jgi:peroxiredoxin
MGVVIGEQAPEFELKDPSGNVVRLSDFRGKSSVALVFYPFTFTGVCHGELCSLCAGGSARESRLEASAVGKS